MIRQKEKLNKKLARQKLTILVVVLSWFQRRNSISDVTIKIITENFARVTYLSVIILCVILFSLLINFKIHAEIIVIP